MAPSAVEPDLACNATPVSAPFSTITIRGQNLTPMPQKTLEDKRHLKLPEIRLTMVTPLAGAVPLTAPLKIADEEGAAEASRVKWTSEEQMAFEIHESDKLPTGVMAIEVTAPDTKQKQTIAGNLAIVPKPVINELDPGAICTDQEPSEVVINGSNFLFYKDSAGAQKGPSVKIGDKIYESRADDATCTAISGSFRETDVKLCNKIRFTVASKDFAVTTQTKFPVSVVNPAPADCQSSETIEITINPPPKVDSVVPANVCEGGSTITINGEGFLEGAKAILACPGGKRIESSSTTVTPDGKQMQATFGPGATAGETCEVIVQNKDHCEDRPLPHKTVTVTAGPIVFYADPPYVYNGVNTQITVFATTITGDPTITITPAGASTPVTTLVDAPVTGHPNRRQATIPAGQAAGQYDLKLQDTTACAAILPKAITVVSEDTVAIKNVVPPFGWTGEDTAITVFRDTAAAAPKNKPFLNGARIFLNPSTAMAGDVAVPLVGTSFIDGDRLTGTVPKGTPVKKYDVIVVNTDGTVGILKNAYDELATAPPVITQVTPSSVVTGTSATVLLSGKNFDPAATFSMRCEDPAGGTTATTTITKGAMAATSATLTVNTTAPDGSVCVLRITNPDGAYSDYSAIGVTGPSLNLSTPKAGTVMNTGRRALSAAAGDATNAQRFVYAIGGDTGMASGALNTYEFAPVDLFGKMGAWTISPVTLADKRTLAGSTTVGRYIYNIGGDLGAGATETAERALILSPLESPEINDVDLALEPTGLDPGFYQYRVSATFATTDTDNPGGESLASDVFSIRIPEFPGKKIQVTLVWRKPVDVLGMPLAGISGYKIYRIAKDGTAGSETLLGTVTGADMLTFKDDGMKTPGSDRPLPVGSTGNWLKLPNMATKRSAPGVQSAFDPDPTTNPNTFYVYAIGGKSSATAANASYEYLRITIAANGRQTAAPSWTAGTTNLAVGRSELGIFKVDRNATKFITNTDVWLFAGGGRQGDGTLIEHVDAAKVSPGGALGAWNAAPDDFTPKFAGYGVCAANDQLFIFGGQGGSPSTQAKSGQLLATLPTMPSNAWNNSVTTQSRYLLGSTVQSAFIFLLGGQTGTEAASKTTETVIW